MKEEEERINQSTVEAKFETDVEESPDVLSYSKNIPERDPADIAYFKAGSQSDPDNIKKLREKALEGDVDSQYELANDYLEGKHGVNVNIDCANYWYEQAAKQGHVESMFLLGKNGNSFWFYRAAVRGHAEAQFERGCSEYLSSVYYKALEPNTIMKKLKIDGALKWFQKSEENGFVPAKFNRGVLLYDIGQELLNRKNSQKDIKQGKEKIKQGKHLICDAAKQGEKRAKVAKSILDLKFWSKIIAPIAAVFALVAMFLLGWSLPKYLCLNEARDITLITFYCLTLLVTILSIIGFIILCPKYKKSTIKKIFNPSERGNCFTYHPYSTFYSVYFTVIALIMLIVSMIIMPALTQPKFTTDFIQCEVLEEGTVAAWCVDFRKEEVIFPQEIDGKQVVEIKSPLTSYSPIIGKNRLKKIVIPSTVKSFEFNYTIDSLTVEIASGTTSVESYLFNYCSSVTCVKLPSTVTSIGAYAFAYCNNLKSIYIPSSVTNIGNSAFSGCNNLTIYCEAESQPSGWASSWNISNCEVVWGQEASNFV